MHTGKTITLDVAPSASVGSVKQALHDAEGVPLAAQRLLFGGKQLSGDSRTLRDCGVEAAATLHLLLRLRGGMRPAHPTPSVCRHFRDTGSCQYGDEIGRASCRERV